MLVSLCCCCCLVVGSSPFFFVCSFGRVGWPFPGCRRCAALHCPCDWPGRHVARRRTDGWRHSITVQPCTAISGAWRRPHTATAATSATGGSDRPAATSAAHAPLQLLDAMPTHEHERATIEPHTARHDRATRPWCTVLAKGDGWRTGQQHDARAACDRRKARRRSRIALRCAGLSIVLTTIPAAIFVHPLHSPRPP